MVGESNDHSTYDIDIRIQKRSQSLNFAVYYFDVTRIATVSANFWNDHCHDEYF
jgi:hypothetical protein